MKIRQYLQEEWFKRIKGGANSVDVFKNPSRKEFNEIISSTKHSNNSVRFIADGKSKNLYVWEVYGSVHADMYRAMTGSDFQDAVYSKSIIPGVADVPRSGKITMYESDWLRDFFLQTPYMGQVPNVTIKDLEQMKKKFKWVETYISIDNWFKNMKKDIKDRMEYET